MPRRAWMLLGWALGLPMSGAPRAGEIDLTVDWAGVESARPYPVTGGVPFARGELDDPARVRVRRGGEERATRAIPLQTEVLARWPDGSVKWLLLDLQLAPGQGPLALEYGDGVAASSPEAVPLAREDGGVVRVDTGPLGLEVRADGSGFIDALRHRDRPVHESGDRRASFFDCVHAASPSGVPPMSRYVCGGVPDPSTVAVDRVSVETNGPLRAVVRIDGAYVFQRLGSTIEGVRDRGRCPFRIRMHAYAGQSFLRVEHFFVYEGDGDHDFGSQLGLKVALPGEPDSVRFVGRSVLDSPARTAGLYQQSSDSFVVWCASGGSPRPLRRGSRFEGVLDVVCGEVGVAVGVKDLWQSAPKSLQVHAPERELGIYFWPPEATSLDFRRHAREWSVGETGTPDDPGGRRPAPLERPNYRLASKGVGRTHYAWIHVHPASATVDEIRAAYDLFQHRPLLQATPRHYASSLALGRYREYVEGEHEEVEAALASGIDVWRSSQERFRWYGFWLYGNVCQDYNGFIPNGRWCREFGRWGWANGDSVGRLAYALMLQAVRKGARADLEFAESYLYHVHDVCSTHTPEYPHHYGDRFIYLRGAAHRHGAWPWACPYVGIRGAHPEGAKIFYYLTGEGHARDILEELTELALRFPNGGEGDGPLGPNALLFLYKWETTGQDEWRQRLKAELEASELLRTADTGWLCMMSAAFGIKNALEEYTELSGDASMAGLASDFADRCMPETMKRHWTWGGYFRVYSAAYNATGDEKYRRAIEEMLEVLVARAKESLAFRVPRDEWPGPAGGPAPFVDGNIIRDVPFALYSLHAEPEEEP